MRIILYDKLVRDRIPEIIEADGKAAGTHVVRDQAYRKALEAKLLEELKEWQESREIEELADLLEVVRAMAGQAGVAFQDLVALADKKRESRGGFTKGIFLEDVKTDSQMAEDKMALIKVLRAYNRSKLGDKDSSQLTIEIKDKENKRVGAISGQITWDYLEIHGLYVEADHRGKGIGRGLVEAAAFEARERFKAPQLELITAFPDLHAFFDRIGCSRQGVLENMPKGFDNVFYYYGTEGIEAPLFNYNVQVSEDAAPDAWLKEKNEAVLAEVGIDMSREETTLAVMDADGRFLGGVYGYITRDWLYTSLLAVDEAARGRGVGNRLMDEIEGWAAKKGIRHAYVGTGEHQARPFYEKRGYRVINTCIDQPIGYECYTLVKEI